MEAFTTLVKLRCPKTNGIYQEMKRFTVKWICVYASIATTVSAVLLIFFELSTKRTKDWSEAVSQMLPHAIFISSGLIALAICASNLGANPKE